uniref:Putative ovule protein n=1 Tax=Solanum chacoense TaxID=4108 RepID=A0A0V0H8V1_SOLCH
MELLLSPKHLWFLSFQTIHQMTDTSFGQFHLVLCPDRFPSLFQQARLPGLCWCGQPDSLRLMEVFHS